MGKLKNKICGGKSKRKRFKVRVSCGNVERKETKGKKGIYYKVVVANTKTIKGTANALELRLEAFLRY